MAVERRFSKQRQIIYDAIMNNPVHPSADVIYNLLRDEYPNLSLGTVYRNLSVLADMGMIKKIVSGSQVEHYDGDTSMHYHMICEKCNNLYDVFSDNAEDLLPVIQKMTKHKLNGYELVLNGICEKCAKKEI